MIPGSRIIWILVLGISMQVSAQFEQDKVLHFTAGQISGAAGAWIASEISHKNRFWTFTGAVGGSLLAGLAKEAIDSGKIDNSWDNTDLGATVLGGITVGITIDIFRAKSRKTPPEMMAFIGYP